MTNCLPLAALPPVSGLLNPIFIGSAAIAGMDSSNNAAQPRNICFNFMTIPHYFRMGKGRSSADFHALPRFVGVSFCHLEPLGQQI
jgi:hypothetical protein